MLRGQRGKAGGDGVEVGNRERGRQRHRQQREPGRRAHRRQVAEVDGERTVADRLGWDERAVEMDPFHDRVDAEHLDAVAQRLDDRGIVADAEEQPVGRRRELLTDARNELALGEASDGQAHGAPERRLTQNTLNSPVDRLRSGSCLR